jgi:hypothetical protein
MPAAPVLLPAVLPPLLPTHETWFEETAASRDWGFVLTPLPLLLCTAVVLVAVAWRLAAVRLPRPELGFLSPLGRLTPWVPRLLAIHLGVALLALAATGAFITPANDHLDGPGGTALLLLEAALGVWLVTGWQTRPAAAIVLGLGPVLALVASPVALLECANQAAVAAFLVLVPPGADRYGAADPSRRQLRQALFAMRLGVGVALIALAFTEKLTYPALAVQTLHDYPALNVFDLAGIPVSPEAFVAVAGAVELLFGLLVISGALPQVTVLVAAVPFNATLLLFGQTELVGHLPVYGVFLALLAYGSDARTAALVPWLPRLRGRSSQRRSVVAASR